MLIVRYSASSSTRCSERTGPASWPRRRCPRWLRRTVAWKTCREYNCAMNRRVLRVPHFVVVLILATPAVCVLAQTPPAAPPAGRGAQMQLSSPTPLTETENLEAYPAAPDGFNVARENIPHGEV